MKLNYFQIGIFLTKEDSEGGLLYVRAFCVWVRNVIILVSFVSLFMSFPFCVVLYHFLLTLSLQRSKYLCGAELSLRSCMLLS